MPVVDHRDEQVALFVEEVADLAEVGHTYPVEFFLDDGGLDTGQQEFVLCYLPEVEEIDIDLQSHLLAPGEYIILELVKSRLLDVDDHIDG